MLYKAILMPIWTYGIEIWGTTSNSNIDVIARFQSKVLRAIVNSPWFVRKTTIRKDPNIRPVKKIVIISSQKYH